MAEALENSDSMAHPPPSVDLIAQIFSKAGAIAVVGLSPKPERPSYGVARYLQRAGFRVIPVNPGQTEVLGEKCYATLREVQEPIDIVDIFRQSEHVPPIVEEAIAVGARVVWMQEGVVHEEAARRATEAGLLVVMDCCIATLHAASGWRRADRP
jgi:predicted CoA-binding protein